MKEFATIIIGILTCAAVYITMSGQPEPKMDKATGGISGKTDDANDGIDKETGYSEIKGEINVDTEASGTEVLGDEYLTGSGGTVVAEQPEPLADYVGCYKDSEDRRFEWPTDKVQRVNVENDPIAECVGYCMADSYNYMGLQYDNECWCGDDWNKIIGLGKADPDKGQCGMKQKVPEQDAYGCRGGVFTNCVYDISGNYITAKSEGIDEETASIGGAIGDIKASAA